MCCHSLEAMRSNCSRAELGVHSTSVLSHTLTNNILDLNQDTDKEKQSGHKDHMKGSSNICGGDCIYGAMMSTQDGFSLTFSKLFTDAMIFCGVILHKKTKRKIGWFYRYFSGFTHQRSLL